MKRWRDQDLFAKMPGEMPNWMLVRDADNKRRSDKEAKLRAARLAGYACSYRIETRYSATAKTPRQEVVCITDVYRQAWTRHLLRHNGDGVGLLVIARSFCGVCGSSCSSR